MKPTKSFKLCPNNIDNLLFDEACLHIYNQFKDTVHLKAISSECYQCDTIQWYNNLHPGKNVSLVVPAIHYLRFDFLSENKSYCLKEVPFGQHGVYQWIINGDCMDINEVVPPQNAVIPLYILMAIIFGVLILSIIINIVCNSHMMTYLFTRNSLSTLLENDLGNPDSSGESVASGLISELVPIRRTIKKRIESLDTFRGLTITLMIFVNYGGGKYWFFKHSPWNGITIADLVFPWFAWIMGLSLVLRYRSELRARVRRRNVLFSSLVRAVSLLAIGFLLNNFNNTDISDSRIPGVLQRLAVAHGIVATLEIMFIRRQPAFQFGNYLDLWESWRQWLVIICLVISHTFVTFTLKVPGCPKGYLGPGGLHEHSEFFNCTGGATGYIDRVVFGEKQIYQNPTSKHVYHSTMPFDPEGLLGILTTCLTVYLGVQAGQILLCYLLTKGRIMRWMFWSMITFISAGFLCNWSQEDGLIPVNKNLWSLSYALLTSSSAFILLSILYVNIDHFHFWSGAPFNFAGKNSILLYVGHYVMKDTLPFRWKVTITNSHSEYLATCVTGTILWLCIAVFLHRKNWFLSI